MIFLVIMLSSSFKMIYFIMMVFLYVLDGPVWLQILQARHDALATWHFGFNNTMELMFTLLMATTLEVCEVVC
jgi:hypothetical protein